MRAIHLALAFLTRVPGPAHAEADLDGPLARATGWYPLAGAVVGATALAAFTAGAWGVSPTVGVVAALAAGWWVTRGFHLDGLADCFDGLLFPGEPARRLEIMRDPRVGALGAASLTVWIVARAAVLLATLDTGLTAHAVWVAAVLSRAPLAAELRLPPATPGRGLFATLHAQVTRSDAARGLLLGLVLALPVIALAPARVAVGAALATLLTRWWHRRWRVAVGGATGDVLGAGVELRELSFLLAFATPLLPP